MSSASDVNAKLQHKREERKRVEALLKECRLAGKASAKRRKDRGGMAEELEDKLQQLAVGERELEIEAKRLADLEELEQVKREMARLKGQRVENKTVMNVSGAEEVSAQPAPGGKPIRKQPSVKSSNSCDDEMQTTKVQSGQSSFHFLLNCQKEKYSKMQNHTKQSLSYVELIWSTKQLSIVDAKPRGRIAPYLYRN